MFYLALLLVFGIALMVISGLLFFAAFVHKDVADRETYTPVDEILQ